MAEVTRGNCKHVRDDGKRCGAFAVDGSGFCFWHHPAKARARAAARKRGGQNRRGPREIHGPAPRVENAGDVLALLQSAIRSGWVIERGEARARTLGYLAGVCLKVIELGELEKRVAELEKLAASENGRSFIRG